MGMNSNFGKTLRFLRQSKNKKITDLADEYLSKSQISRFERGESEISFSRLLNLINKLNISFDEFLFFSHYDLSNIETLVINIQKELSANKIQSIEQLIESLQYDDSKILEKIMIKSILSENKKNFLPTKEEIEIVTDYLFGVEIWGRFELILLGNCANIINYNFLFLLTKEMLNKMHLDNSSMKNKKILLQLSINCLIKSIDNMAQENCKFLRLKIESLLTDELFFYEQTIFLYVNGYYKFQFNIDKESGTKEMNDALQIFKVLNQVELYNNYKKHFLNLKS